MEAQNKAYRSADIDHSAAKSRRTGLSVSKKVNIQW